MQDSTKRQKHLEIGKIVYVRLMLLCLWLESEVHWINEDGLEVKEARQAETCKDRKETKIMVISLCFQASNLGMDVSCRRSSH